MDSSIISDWIKVFPQLTKISSTRIIKVFDPIIIGIQLDVMRGGEEYAPNLVIYPLWKGDINECLDNPVVFHPLLERDVISFNEHDVYFERLSKKVIKNMPFDVSAELSYRKLISFLNKVIDEPFLKAQGERVNFEFLEFEFYVSLLMGDDIRAFEIIQTIERNDRFKSSKILEKLYGDIDDFANQLKNMLNKFDVVKYKIEENLKSKKMQKVIYSKVLNENE